MLALVELKGEHGKKRHADTFLVVRRIGRRAAALQTGRLRVALLASGTDGETLNVLANFWLQCLMLQVRPMTSGLRVFNQHVCLWQMEMMIITFIVYRLLNSDLC